VFVTPDKNIVYQQNLKGRKISIIVLGNAQAHPPPAHGTRSRGGECRRAWQLHRS
jgi:hypothetical protein